MAHETPRIPGHQRAAPSDDPTLPDGPGAEPSDTSPSTRRTGMGVLAALLFLIVFLAGLLAAIVWAVTELT